MKSLLFTLLLCAPLAAHADDISPSSLMAQLPLIPTDVSTANCQAASPIIEGIEQRAMEDMMRAQQMAMGTAGGGPVSSAQGRLIEKLADPALMMCEMNAAQASADPRQAFEEEMRNVQAEVTRDVESRCPVTGMADYREPACVDPLTARGIERERAALARYVENANKALQAERNLYSGCARNREDLAAQAEASRLPMPYLSMAMNARAGGWQNLAALAERYEQSCAVAVDAYAALRERTRY